MGGRRNKQAKLTNKKNQQENKMVKNIDELAAYEQFKIKFAPELRKMLLSGKKGQEILKKFESLATARLVQIAGTGRDMQALSAIREIFDRLHGKPPVKTEQTHKFQKLADEELDALLESNIASLEAIELKDPNIKDDDEEENE